MRLTLILIISFLTLSVAGQIEPLNKKEANVSMNNKIGELILVNDSIPNVEYIKTIERGKPAIFYINGKIVNSSILKTIDSKLIDNIQIDKNEIEINGKKYYGHIFLKMKNEYYPKLISLTDLKSKYLNPSNKPSIFMIDNDIIKGDYKDYMVDENFILKIVVDNVENDELNIEIVRLITRSEKNIKDPKKIMIRGLDELTME